MEKYFHRKYDTLKLQLTRYLQKSKILRSKAASFSEVAVNDTRRFKRDPKSVV